MRAWVLITTLALIGTAGLVVVLILWVQTSLWLVWELVEPTKGTAIAATADWLEVEIVARQPILTPGVEQVRDYLAQSRHLAWSQDDEEVVRLAILPKLTQQISLELKLEQEGWVVERRGLVLQAHLRSSSSGGQARQESNWQQSHLRALRNISRPRMLGKKGEINWVAYKTGQQEVQVAIKMEGQPASPAGRPEGSFKQLEASEVGDREMLVQAPGQVWQQVPAKWRELVEGEIASRLDFVYTKPNFLAAFARAAQAWLWLSGEEKVVVGIKDPLNAEAWRRQAEEWLQEEERRERSETQAFRLPDGTLGWEKIPGEAKELSPLNNHCQQIKSWYLCEQAEKGVLSNDRELALSQLSQEKSEVEVRIGGEWLKKEGIGLESLDIIGNQKQVVLILKLGRKL
jgi:hypothetical protein